LGKGEEIKGIGGVWSVQREKRKHYLIKKLYYISKINKIMQNWVPKKIMVGRVGT
jgi:hypothetical protein